MKLLEQPGNQTRLGDWLNNNLNRDWSAFRAAIAFAKRSGVRHIAAALSRFAASKHVEIVVGVDHQGTSYEGLKDLLDSVPPNGRIVVFHNLLQHTFHPKLFLFSSPDQAEFVIGSGNLTRGGFYTNYEVGLQVSLDLHDPTSRELFGVLDGILNGWTSETSGTSRVLDYAFLELLFQSGLVVKEAEMVGRNSRKSRRTRNGASSEFREAGEYFRAVAVPHAPSTRHPNLGSDLDNESTSRNFAMTLQKTDVGVGQTTEGTARRSPEIFVPLKARNAHPDFWDWPFGFEEDSTRPGKYDRSPVRMLVNDTVVLASMMGLACKARFQIKERIIAKYGQCGRDTGGPESE